MTKIQKISSFLLCVFNVLLIGIPLFMVLRWGYIEVEAMNLFGVLEQTISTPEGFVKLSEVQWTMYTKLLGLMASLLGLLTFLMGLWVLKAIFKKYQKGEIFSVTNAQNYKKLGWLFFIDALLVKPISEGLEVLAVTLSNPPGSRYITLHLGVLNLQAIFCGILLIVISWVMLEASKIHDDQQFTI